MSIGNFEDKISDKRQLETSESTSVSPNPRVVSLPVSNRYASSRLNVQTIKFEARPADES